MNNEDRELIRATLDDIDTFLSRAQATADFDTLVLAVRAISALLRALTGTG